MTKEKGRRKILIQTESMKVEGRFYEVYQKMVDTIAPSSDFQFLQLAQQKLNQIWNISAIL